MKTLCKECAKITVATTWWRALALVPVCDLCLWRAEVARSEPEPEPAYPDPLDEEEPEGIDVCGPCQGVGDVLVLDPTGRPRVEYGTNAPVIATCSACEGSGLARPALGARVPYPEWAGVLGREPVG